MVKVYRVENKHNPLEGMPWDDIDLNHWGYLPCPAIEMWESRVCGTTSLKALRKWFPAKTMRQVHNHNDLRVIVLDVPKKNLLYRGHLQCVFNRRKGKIIGEIIPYGKAQYHRNIKGSKR